MATFSRSALSCGSGSNGLEEAGSLSRLTGPVCESLVAGLVTVDESRLRLGPTLGLDVESAWPVGSALSAVALVDGEVVVPKLGGKPWA